jgi:hypothetical protein
MEAAVRTAGGPWTRAARVAFEDEQALQKLLHESPELVLPEADRTAVFVREAGLPGSGNTDLLGVDREGALILVEMKLARNHEIRRKVVGQILEYAAHLWGMNYEALDHIFRGRPPYKTIIERLRDNFGDIDAEELRKAVQRNLDDGTFELIVAVDDMNPELQQIIDYVAERGDGLRLTALEVKFHRCAEQEVLVLERHGATSASPTIGSGLKLTEEQMLANCRDDVSRDRLAYLLRRWHEMGHSVLMGTQGVSLRADVAGDAIPLFWLYPDSIQNAFGKHLLDRGAPPNALDSYRAAVSRIPGYDSRKIMQRSQPMTKWERLSEESIESFLAETSRFLVAWTDSLHLPPAKTD